MEYLEPKINQLIAEKPGRQKKIIRSFETKPTKSLAAKFGKIFGLIEIESSDSQTEKLVDLIIDDIKNNYYYPQNISDENISDINISSHFESALKKTNISIASFLESEQITVDLDKVNIFIAICNGSDIHFTLTGKLGIILLYNISPINYKIIDVLDTISNNWTVADPLKFFSQVISGKIRQRDILFISTDNILDYFSLEKIKNIITKDSPSEGIANFKKLLDNINSQENFGAIILELAKTVLPVKRPTQDNKEFSYKMAAQKDSIKELLNTENETQKLLTPSAIPEIKKYAKLLTNSIKNNFGKIKKNTNRFYYDKKVAFKKPLEKIANNGLGQIKNLPFIRPAVNLSPIKSFIKKITDFIKNSRIWPKFSSILKKIFGGLIIKFKRLPASSRILLVITLILSVLFSQSIFWLNRNNNESEKSEKINQMIVDIEDKKNDAESSLIYRDENQARTLLIEAKNLLLGLDNPPEKSQKEKIKTLLEGINNKLNELQHLTIIENPLLIANLSDFNSQANVGSTLTIMKDNLYVQNQSNQSIFKVSVENKNASEIKMPSNFGKIHLAAAVNEKEIFFLNESKTSFSFDIEKESVSDTKVSINNNSNIIDIASYNEKIYFLDSGNSQIYRYSKISGFYGNQTNWLKQEIDLKNTKSIAIDGFVYTINENGEIIQMLNGKKTDFKSGLIYPEIIKASKIRTSDTSKYLYILDSATKRIIIIDKDGKLAIQYSSDKFDNLKDFVFNEEKKEIYILNGNSIFSIPADFIK